MFPVINGGMSGVKHWSLLIPVIFLSWFGIGSFINGDKSRIFIYFSSLGCVFLVLHLLLFLLLNLFLPLLLTNQIDLFGFVHFYFFWYCCFWLSNNVWSFFCLDRLFIKRCNKRCIQLCFLIFNNISKRSLYHSGLVVENDVFFNALSILNHPVDNSDWPSNLSKPFLRIVTNAFFVSSN